MRTSLHGHHGHHTHAHTFKNVAECERRFEAPERSIWQKPAEVIGALNVQREDRVADIGAGTGYFTLPLARAVGEDGCVFAVDSEPGMIRYLEKRIEKEHAPMVRPILAKHGRGVALEALDLAFSCNTYHHLEDRIEYWSRFGRLLKPDGRVAIVDWTKRPMPLGPPKEMRLSAHQVSVEMRSAGFSLEQRETFLPHQYFLVFRKRGSSHPVRGQGKARQPIFSE
jgi:ubiquinone/menaquinone biosynthesis C-methylase UbiE